jgi:biopolymer transport protein ExbB
MKRTTLLAGLCCALAIAGARADAPRSISELVGQVRRESALEKQQNLEREQRFAAAKDEQQRLLAEAQAELRAIEQRSAESRRVFEENARRIDEQEQALKQRLGYIHELHGVVRQIASDMQGSLETSMVSAQKPDRAAIASELATSTELPSIEALEQLWHQALDEMAESGRVVRFNTTIINAEGQEAEREITRVGIFNALAGGHYLRYLPETGKFLEPPRQPPNRLQAMARDLEQAQIGVHPIALDPTRGNLLALLIQTPDFGERIEQGGPVGYVIIVLGVIGLLLALERFIVLTLVERQVQRQLRDQQPGANPLGRIMAVYYDNRGVDTETLGHKLDEAILKEVNPLQRGLGALSLLAAVAPLLGLLGTVTGIVKVFQTITLFGTGDPKLMSAGISEALVTTVEGLTVAIPLLLIHSFLAAKSNRVIQILDQQSAAYVAALSEDDHKRHARIA